MATTETLIGHISIEAIPAHKPSEDLVVHDNRTGQEYVIPIVHNAISAKAFQAIKAPENTAYPPDQTENGLRLYDPGYSNTAVSQSKVTYVDGIKGTINYRGIPIADLIGNTTFEDTAHLLIWGALPSPQEKEAFSQKLKKAMVPSQNISQVIRSFPPSSPPVTLITAGLAALQAFQQQNIPAVAAKNLYLGNMARVDEQIINLLANLALVSALAYCHHTGRVFREPQPQFPYVKNFLHMIGHVEPESGFPLQKHVDNLERLWTLVADHEMTCSTAALLQTASALPDAISCQISAISASYGILHGGAIEVAYKNFEEVRELANCKAKIEAVKAGKERLYGYGHRIYKTVDPRYIHIRKILDECNEEIKADPVLSIAMELDRIASEDEYFTSRKLKANADLFASFVYKAMGFNADFILPLSLLARTQGLMAHWREAMSGKPNIWRPQQLYTGIIGPDASFEVVSRAAGHVLNQIGPDVIA